MHFVVDALREVSVISSVPIYDRKYLYHGIGRGGVLVVNSGVIIETLGDGNGTVRWGSDAKYSEPVTTSLNYAGLGSAVTFEGYFWLPCYIPYDPGILQITW